MLILAGSSNLPLAKNLVEVLRTVNPSSQLINCEITKLANDEKKVQVQDEDSVRGQKICLVQSFSKPVDENIIETLLIVDALERMGAKEISLIIPWTKFFAPARRLPPKSWPMSCPTVF